MGPLIPLFWTSGNVCPGFQHQGGSLACFLAWVILRFTSGVIPVNCKGVSMAAKPFDPHACRCVHKHWWRFGARTHEPLRFGTQLTYFSWWTWMRTMSKQVMNIFPILSIKTKQNKVNFGWRVNYKWLSTDGKRNLGIFKIKRLGICHPIKFFSHIFRGNWYF